MRYIVKVDERQFDVDINGHEAFVTINGRKIAVDLRQLRGGKIHSLLVDNINYEFEIEKSNGGFDIWHGSEQMHVAVNDEKSERFEKLMGAVAGNKKAQSLKAPMPGLILKIEVEPGQHVKKGDGLIIVEAMKMENELRAHSSAVIKEIKIIPGQAVEKNQVLLIFE